MDQIVLPLPSKWACIFSTKDRARYLDMFRMYADGTFDRQPYGSICLDAPLILLNPEAAPEVSNSTRPSNIAQACDLFPDPACYKFLRMIEDEIITRQLWRGVSPLLFLISELDDQYLPQSILAVDYGEAVAQLRELTAAPPPPKPTP